MKYAAITSRNAKSILFFFFLSISAMFCPGCEPIAPEIFNRTDIMIRLLLVGYSRVDLTIDSLDHDFIPPKSSISIDDCHLYGDLGYIKLFTSDRVIGIYQIECGDKLIIDRTKNGVFIVKTDIIKRFNEPIPFRPYACFRNYEGVFYFILVFSIVSMFFFVNISIVFLFALAISGRKVWAFISGGYFRKKLSYLFYYFLLTIFISFLLSFACIVSGAEISSNTISQLSKIAIINTALVEKIEKTYGE